MNLAQMGVSAVLAILHDDDLQRCAPERTATWVNTYQPFRAVLRNAHFDGSQRNGYPSGRIRHVHLGNHLGTNSNRSAPSSGWKQACAPRGRTPYCPLARTSAKECSSRPEQSPRKGPGAGHQYSESRGPQWTLATYNHGHPRREEHRNDVRLRAIRLPVRFQQPVTQSLHTKALCVAHHCQRIVPSRT
jgi:hypothetical protein